MLHVGCMLIAYWLHVGCILVACWLHVCCMLVACWLRVGCMLIACWWHFNCTLIAFWFNVYAFFLAFWLRFDCNYCIKADRCHRVLRALFGTSIYLWGSYIRGYTLSRNQFKYVSYTNRLQWYVKVRPCTLTFRFLVSAMRTIANIASGIYIA